jgi:hypothetical protein
MLAQEAAEEVEMDAYVPSEGGYAQVRHVCAHDHTHTTCVNTSFHT